MSLLHRVDIDAIIWRWPWVNCGVVTADEVNPEIIPRSEISARIKWLVGLEIGSV